VGYSLVLVVTFFTGERETESSHNCITDKKIKGPSSWKTNENGQGAGTTNTL